MRTTVIKFQPETVAAMLKIDPECVDAQSMTLGVNGGEPLLVCLDGLLRYAKAYEKRFEGKLSDDAWLGEQWLDALNGVHALLNSDGAVALEKGITTDSKCNGVLEDIYWHAMNAAGFKDETAVAS